MSKLNNSVAFSLPQVSVPDPLQKATYNRVYVDFGYDNMYSQYVADLTNLSPTHSAILDSKINLLNASLEIDDTVDIKIDLEDVDGNGTTIEDFYFEVFTNLGTFEGAYVEVIYNKAKTRIVNMSVLPFETVRVGKYNEEGIIDTVYISPDWSRKFIKRNAPKPMAVFDPENIDTDSQVIIVRTRKPNQPYYPIPSWMSAVQWILLEDDIAEYSRNSILNGFTPSTILNFHDGEPTEDDKSMMESYIKRKFTGKNSSKFMLFFDNDRDKAVDITQMDIPDLSKYWETISPIVTEKIFTGHKIYPSLVGVPVSNGFSSNKDELLSQYDLYLRTSILPLQKLALSILRKVIKFNVGDAVEIRFRNELISSDNATDVTAEENTEDNTVNNSDNSNPELEKGGTQDEK
jgi:hypothetical protein